MNAAEKNAKRPISIVVISSLLAVESLLLMREGMMLLFGALEAIHDFSGLMRNKIIFLAGWFFLLAVFLAVAGHYFFRGRRRARAPVLVWQLLMIAVFFGNIQAGAWAAAPGICAAVIVLLLFTKPVTQFLRR